MTEKKPFKILSIDGGGIRGVFPAMFLTNVEAKLKSDGNPNWHIYENFDLICGTSTGGIIAIALALGIPAKEIYDIYIENASTIFGNKKSLLRRIRFAAHEREGLERLIRKKFSDVSEGTDPRLKDCKTALCIPIYDLLTGEPSVLKTKHHKNYNRDYHIPAYQVAMATSAAPTFFSPFSSNYIDLNGIEKDFSNKVDGGVFQNNPSLIGIEEAQNAFCQPIEHLRVLSIGTGHVKFTDSRMRKKWGLWYWMQENGKTRLIDLFMQAQSQHVQNTINIINYGIAGERRDHPRFMYDRIDTVLDDTLIVELDEIDTVKLKRFAAKASSEFQKNASTILHRYFSSQTNSSH